MMHDRQFALKEQKLFSDLKEELIAEIASACTEIQLDSGEELYCEGDEPEGMFILLQGAVELVSLFSGGMEKVFSTMTAGKSFGLLSFLDEGRRPATARAVEESRLLRIDRESLGRIRESDALAWAGILRAFAEEMAARTRLLIEQYRQCVLWNLQVSGCADLNLGRLMEDSFRIEIRLMDGSTVDGLLVGVERNGPAPELLLKTSDGGIRIIPYHAVLQITTVGTMLPGEALD